MLSKEDAETIALDNLNKGYSVPGDELVIKSELTEEAKLCWIVYYDSKLYLETNNVVHAIAGNVPLLVNKQTGDVELCCRRDLRELLAKYEEKHGLN